MSMKWASEELLKLADAIDKEAAEVTKFVCADCNHTATLASINQKREEVAKTADEKIIVAALTVEDKVHCPACKGIMAYSATEDSAPYYFDTEKKASDDKDDNGNGDDDNGDDVPEKKKASEPIDYDSLQRYLA